MSPDDTCVGKGAVAGPCRVCDTCSTRNLPPLAVLLQHYLERPGSTCSTTVGNYCHWSSPLAAYPWVPGQLHSTLDLAMFQSLYHQPDSASYRVPPWCPPAVLSCRRQPAVQVGKPSVTVAHVSRDWACSQLTSSSRAKRYSY